MIFRLDEDQQSEEYDSRIPSRQGCNSRRSGTFISDDEDDNDKGRKLYYPHCYFIRIFQIHRGILEIIQFILSDKLLDGAGRSWTEPETFFG